MLEIKKQETNMQMQETTDCNLTGRQHFSSTV